MDILIAILMLGIVVYYALQRKKKLQKIHRESKNSEIEDLFK